MTRSNSPKCCPNVSKIVVWYLRICKQNIQNLKDCFLSQHLRFSNIFLEMANGVCSSTESFLCRSSFVMISRFHRLLCLKEENIFHLDMVPVFDTRCLSSPGNSSKTNAALDDVRGKVSRVQRISNPKKTTFQITQNSNKMLNKGKNRLKKNCQPMFSFSGF